jgi:hypothetical protein
MRYKKSLTARPVYLLPGGHQPGRPLYGARERLRGIDGGALRMAQAHFTETPPLRGATMLIGGAAAAAFAIAGAIA